MKLERVQVKNFRLLHDVELTFEDNTTVIVGRNNSGKTSLYEVLRRFLSDKNISFDLQDFSIECHQKFISAFEAKGTEHEVSDIRKILPYIELRLYFQYDPKQTEIGLLSEFIIDLDMDCKKALVVMRYELPETGMKQFFEEGIDTGGSDKERKAFFRKIAERIRKLYKINVWAEDPNDPENKKIVSPKSIGHFLRTGFINAQRGLDDTTNKDTDVLAKILEGLYKAASLETADKEERKVVEQLETAVQSIQDNIDGEFHEHLKELLPAIKEFGYPGINGPELTTETTFDVQRLLANNTKVRYEGQSGVFLPESYNGLGMRNLIFILLQIIRFYREYRAQEHSQGVYVLFIEEPEAHLHPQMQEVFIRQIGEIIDKLDKKHKGEPNWPVQIVVSTHSSHIANEVNFEAIRYFMIKPITQERITWQTEIKNLYKSVAVADQNFLNQYLTLTRCDLFFADKAILIEGTTERLLLPEMIKKSDKEFTSQLRSQYLTIIEVGGAYAHKFFGLLNFLELKTLIITDIDPVDEANGQGKRCLVHEAKATSNACINAWFDKPIYTPNELIKKSEAERVRGCIRLAHQYPENEDDACGRTFEDAFILANPNKFELSGETFQDQANNAWQEAQKMKKSKFALKYAIEDTEWIMPRYIKEGLCWLAKTTD